MKVLLESKGQLRNTNDLSLLGYWFKQDNVIYYILI